MSERASGRSRTRRSDARTDGRTGVGERNSSFITPFLSRTCAELRCGLQYHTHTHVLPSHLTLPSRLTLEIVTDHHHSVFVLVRRALPKSTLVRVIVPQTRSVRCRKRRREFGARISRSLGRRRPRPRPSPFEDNNLWASVYVPLPSARILAIYGKVEGRVKSASRSDSSSAMF